MEACDLKTTPGQFCWIFVITCLSLLSVSGYGADLSQASQPSETYRFEDVKTEFEKLCSNPKVSRVACTSVARKFHAIHINSKAHDSAPSLFFAGKSFLQAYRANNNVQDLDAGIRTLNEFKKIRPKSPYYNHALVELKDAHILKRKIKNRPVSPVQISKRPSKAPDSGTTRLADSDVGGYKAPFVKDVDKRMAAEVEKNPRATVSGLESRSPLTRNGNPFYDGLADHREKKDVPPVRVAALPPKVVSDTRPLKKSPEATSGHKPKSRVIVLDPGHGGKDPGAVSRDGSLTEKDVTLRIAKKLKTLLEKTIPHVTVKLTRDDDSFLSLKDRTAMANAANADLFVSIHCNGSEYFSASGIETFFLSQANSRGAMRAAARENGISISKMNHLEATLIDLMVTSKRTESEKLAELIHECLIESGTGKTGKSRDRGVKQAPFYVLMGAAMPAILVECAFISNMTEKDNLKNERYIDMIAARMTTGAKKYLDELGGNI